MWPLWWSGSSSMLLVVGEEGRGECVEGGPWGYRAAFRTLLKGWKRVVWREECVCSRMFEWKKADVKDGLSTRARGGEWICFWCHAGEGVLRRQC